MTTGHLLSQGRRHSVRVQECRLQVRRLTDASKLLSKIKCEHAKLKTKKHSSGTTAIGIT